MKVEVNKTEKKFEPIELKITIESQNEYVIISTISSLNSSIPDIVSDFDKSISRNSVKDFLNTLRYKLNNN